MSYSLEQFADDCHQALVTDPGPGGREVVRQCVARACKDADFVRTHLGPDNTTERQIIYEDADLGFCILAHVYSGAKESHPHDHASTWAIYGQADGVTVRTYKLEPGDAHVYQVGDLHSPGRDGPTRLVRIEGMNMAGVKRDSFRPV